MKIPKIPNLMTLIALNNLLVPSPPIPEFGPNISYTILLHL